VPVSKVPLSSVPFVLVLFLAVAGPAPSPAAAAGNPCQNVVQFMTAAPDRSGLRELKHRLESHQTTMLILNKDPTPGPGWREGNAYWQEAYALLQPEIYKHLQDADAQELRHVRDKLPALLSSEFCSRYESLLRSHVGGSAERLRESHQTRAALEDYERKGMTTPRFEAFTQRVRRFIDEGLKIARDPDFQKNQASYQDAYQSLAHYDSALTAELQRLPPAEGTEGEKDSREYLVKILRRHQDRLIDIVRRFLLSTR
jgi:hypothetical protein